MECTSHPLYNALHYMKVFLSILTLFLVVGCGKTNSAQDLSGEETFNSSVVYGNDSRVDVNQMSSDILSPNIAASAAVFSSENLVPKEKTFTLRGRTLGEKKGLCRGERFESHWSAARCSAVLIDKKLILTAGHCIPDQKKCDGSKIVFGWHKDSKSVEKAKTYSCKKWIAGAQGNGGLDSPDFALIQLDREVSQVAPVAMSFETLKENELIYTVGHPNGTSAKYSEGKITYGSDYSANSMAEIDGFTGNSGGPIFDQNHRLRGIYSYGEQDFQLNEKKGCYGVKRCASGQCNEEILLNLRAIEKEIDQAKKL